MRLWLHLKGQSVNADFASLTNTEETIQENSGESFKFCVN